MPSEDQDGQEFSRFFLVIITARGRFLSEVIDIEKGRLKEEASQIFGVKARTLFNCIKRKEHN